MCFNWVARRRDSRQTLSAGGPETLRDRIRPTTCARPVSTQVNETARPQEPGRHPGLLDEPQVSALNITASGWTGQLSVEQDAVSAEVRDDLQPTAERLDVAGQGADLGRAGLGALDGRHSLLPHAHPLSNLRLSQP